MVRGVGILDGIKKLEKIESERRVKFDNWENKVSDEVYGILNSIAEEYDQLFSHATNQGNSIPKTVGIFTKKGPSGLVEINEDEERMQRTALEKTSGLLHLTPQYNGQIKVSAHMPTIEKEFPDMYVVDLDTIDQQDIDKEYLESKVVEFIDYLIEWEKDPENFLIGSDGVSVVYAH